MDQTAQPLPPNRKAIIFIVVTVILNTLGFTMIAPVAPFLVAHYVSDPNRLGIAVGWLGSIYAICQFIAAPGLGLLSDRFGRRPLLLLCLLGSAIGYALLGLGGSLWVLFLGRAIDGITGANTSILIAYITDVVPASERTRYFGIIGAIGAMCVVLGPAAGGLLAQFGVQVPFFTAGVVALAGVIFGIFFMPESLAKSQRTHSISVVGLNPINALKEIFTIPQLRWLMIAMFLYTFSTVILPSNMGLFAKDSLNWGTDRVGFLFSVFGISSVLVQGVILQRALKHISILRVTKIGLWITFGALLLVALVGIAHSSAILFFSIIVFALGEGLTSPTTLDLITQATDEGTQGKVQGGNQSVQSLANIASPILAGLLYDHYGHSSPYFFGASIILLVFGSVVLAFPAHSHPAQDAGSSNK